MSPDDPADRERTGWTTAPSLIEGIRANRSEAWERFTQLYTVLLHYWFRRDGVNEGEWPDLTSEVFLAVVRGLPTYEHTAGRGALRGWLRVISRNKVADLRRGRAPAPTDPRALDTVAAPVPTDEAEEYALLLKRALALIQTDFEPTTWQAFCFTKLEGQTAADAAAALGISLNAVYLATGRVQKRLRDELDGPPPA